MYEPRLLSMEELLQLIYKLNNSMVNNDMNYEELYIVGGYVCLINKDKQLTADIDFYSKNDIQNVRQLAYNIGMKYDALGWLSDMYSLAHKGYCVSLEELLSVKNSFKEYLTLSKLKLYIQTDKCILYTKLNSGRDKDILDVKHILVRLDLHDKNQILCYINEYLSLPSTNIDIIESTISYCLK